MNTSTIPRRYIEQLFHDNELVELRVLGERVLTGLYSDMQAFLADASNVDGGGRVYCSLNKPANHSATNRLDSGRALRDSDISQIKRLLFDFDPIRHKGTNSNHQELAQAEQACRCLESDLSGFGWPEPIRGFSGNGHHLQYCVDLPNTRETRDLLSGLYGGLAQRYSTERVAFDTTVRNPSRICRLYGTLNCKGPDTAERPQRRSDVTMPRVLGTVSECQLRELADQYLSEAAVLKSVTSPSGERWRCNGGRGDYATLDVVSWFISHDCYRRPSEKARIHFVVCPWNDQHTTTCANGTDTIIFEADVGWPGFHCSHGHCAGRNIRDVLDLWRDADDYCSQLWRNHYD